MHFDEIALPYRFMEIGLTKRYGDDGCPGSAACGKKGRFVHELEHFAAKERSVVICLRGEDHFCNDRYLVGCPIRRSEGFIETHFAFNADTICGWSAFEEVRQFLDVLQRHEVEGILGAVGRREAERL